MIIILMCNDINIINGNMMCVILLIIIIKWNINNINIYY